MMAKAVVNRAPPPIPWIARKTMSCTMPPPMSGSDPNSPDSPDSQDPARKKLIPASRMGLRPNRSPSLPQMGTITVEDSR